MARTAHPAAYDTDFAAWSEQQATAIREQRWGAVDVENVAEEIAALARSDKNAVGSRARIILQHMLKLRYQPGSATRSWRGTMREQAARLADVLADSPSLRRVLDARLAKAYAQARRGAADETGLPLATFPETLPSELEAELRAALDEAAHP